MVRDKSRYVCRKKRRYAWLSAHIRKYQKWPSVHLYVYRCPSCGWYHLTKRWQGKLAVATVFVIIAVAILPFTLDIARI